MPDARPDLQYTKIIDRYAARDPQLIERASGEFAGIVSPDIPEDDAERREAYQAHFTEWLVFDRKLENGKSLLEDYVDDPSEDEDEKTLARLRQIAKTQFCGMFAIVGVIESFSLLTLEDLSAGERYPVFDENVCASLSGNVGVLGVRLANIDGKWRLPGNPVFFMPVQATEEALASLREGAPEHVEFADLVSQVFGRRDDLNFHVETSFDMTPEECGQALRDAEASYADLRARNPHLPTWEDVARAIKEEDGSVTPNDLLLSLFADETGMVDLDADEAVGQLVSCFFNAWNLLPHKSMGGKSPIDLAQEERAAE